MVLPPTESWASVTSEVASFAPARQTCPNGTRSPKTLRPFIRGLEYSTVTVLPSASLQVAYAGGLGRWLLSFGAASAEVARTTTLRNTARLGARFCMGSLLAK